MIFPLGPLVASVPQAQPEPVVIPGRYCVLEPLHPDHAAALWEAAQGADESWTYLAYGPFPSVPAMGEFLHGFVKTPDAVAWAVRPSTGGGPLGWLTLMDAQPRNAAIELGNTWFSPKLQRTAAAREAIYLLLSHAADRLGYYRLTWKCNALNEASRRAAERLGFCFEGVLRANLVVKGRRRDTAYYSILGEEWPRCRTALEAWLAPENFGQYGTALRSLTSIRSEIAPCRP